MSGQIFLYLSGGRTLWVPRHTASASETKPVQVLNFVTPMELSRSFYLFDYPVHVVENAQMAAMNPNAKTPNEIFAAVDEFRRVCAEDQNFLLQRCYNAQRPPAQQQQQQQQHLPPVQQQQQQQHQMNMPMGMSHQVPPVSQQGAGTGNSILGNMAPMNVVNASSGGDGNSSSNNNNNNNSNNANTTDLLTQLLQQHRQQVPMMSSTNHSGNTSGGDKGMNMFSGNDGRGFQDMMYPQQQQQSMGQGTMGNMGGYGMPMQPMNYYGGNQGQGGYGDRGMNSMYMNQQHYNQQHQSHQMMMPMGRNGGGRNGRNQNMNANMGGYGPNYGFNPMGMNMGMGRGGGPRNRQGGMGYGNQHQSAPRVQPQFAGEVRREPEPLEINVTIPDEVRATYANPQLNLVCATMPGPRMTVWLREHPIPTNKKDPHYVFTKGGIILMLKAKGEEVKESKPVVLFPKQICTHYLIHGYCSRTSCLHEHHSDEQLRELIAARHVELKAMTKAQRHKLIEDIMEKEKEGIAQAEAEREARAKERTEAAAAVAAAAAAPTTTAVTGTTASGGSEVTANSAPASQGQPGAKAAMHSDGDAEREDTTTGSQKKTPVASQVSEDKVPLSASSDSRKLVSADVAAKLGVTDSDDDDDDGDSSASSSASSSAASSVSDDKEEEDEVEVKDTRNVETTPVSGVKSTPTPEDASRSAMVTQDTAAEEEEQPESVTEAAAGNDEGADEEDEDDDEGEEDADNTEEAEEDAEASKKKKTTAKKPVAKKPAPKKRGRTPAPKKSTAKRAKK